MLYGKWLYITTTALTTIRSSLREGQARFGIDFEIATTYVEFLMNTFRNGGHAWDVLAEFYHPFFVSVVRLFTRPCRTSTLLPVIRTYRPGRSLHLNPRTDGTG